MATIYVRPRTLADGSRRFDVRYRRGGRYTELEHGGTFTTQKAANARKALIDELLAAGLNPKVELRRRLRPERSLREAAAGWIEARRNVKPRTRESYAWRELAVLERFGDEAVDEILVEDVIAWIAVLERDYKPGSIRGLVDVLRMMIDHTGAPNVARDRRVRLPRNDRVQLEPPDAAAVVAMLSELTERHVPAAIAMEILGTRVSETLGIQQRDLHDGAVRIRAEIAKNGKSRLVPAPQFLTDALATCLPLPPNRQAVGNAMRRAGGIHPHALRHRRATLWYQQGLGPVEIAQRLGNRPSISLDVYVHVEPLHEIEHQTLAAFLK